jgi:hypothetical protein
MCVRATGAHARRNKKKRRGKDNDASVGQASNEVDSPQDRETQVLALVTEARAAEKQQNNTNQRINTARLNDDALSELRALALSPGGLGTNRARAKAWPMLLHVNPRTFRSPSMALKVARETSAVADESRSAHVKDAATWAKQEMQVGLDVNRALGHVDVARAMTPNAREVVRRNLNDAVLAVLRRQPSLHYYQVRYDWLRCTTAYIHTYIHT